MNLHKIFSFLKLSNITKQNSSSQIVVTNTTYDFPSLSLATDFTWDLIQAQTARANALDSKANFILGAATTLISAVLVIFPLMLTSHSACSAFVPTFIHVLPTLTKRIILVFPILVIYIVVMSFAYQAYKIRDYTEVPIPRNLLNKYLSRQEDYTKAVIFQAMVEAYEENENEITNKAKYIYFAFTFLMIEALLLVFLLLLRFVC